jgi:hypothetical protein
LLPWLLFSSASFYKIDMRASLVNTEGFLHSNARALGSANTLGADAHKQLSITLAPLEGDIQACTISSWGVLTTKGGATSQPSSSAPGLSPTAGYRTASLQLVLLKSRVAAPRGVCSPNSDA